MPDLDRPLALDLFELEKNLIRIRYARGVSVPQLSDSDELRAADEMDLETYRRPALTAVSKEVDIVDPYFDLRPTKGNYLATLVSLLVQLARDPGQSKAIRIHFRDHDTRP